MKPLQKKDLIWLSFLLLSGVITYISVDIGMGRAFAGQPVLVWLHALLFIAAVGAVIGAIVFKSK